MPFGRSRALHVLRRLFPASVRTRARAAIFRWLDLSWTTASGVVLRVENYDEWIIHQEVFVDGEYDRAIDAALGAWEQQRPLRVVDLGANVGFFVLRFADRLGARRDDPWTLLAIEPGAESAAEFRRRVFDDNRLQPHVTLIQGLVGQATGSAELREGSHPGGHSIVTGASGRATTVPFVDLDALFAHDAAIDLLKCDIEGAELMLAQHHPAVLQKTRVVVIEMHEALCDTARCRQLLATLGFEPQHGLRDREGASLYLGFRHRGTAGR